MINFKKHGTLVNKIKNSDSDKNVNMDENFNKININK